ncbi:unnamed protein product [Prorocentrum cordatum]|uniref:Ribosome biogenesis protein NOP53 n=1 Tax=Prorocentrum cordatum TaxID=2364126 RepID=A0ABN9UJA3_9DINO|nr:unnamed protein product [Polarella glacialis]|mmetsp:Transcript_77175/g.204886  ORF Transcript_77175/g.204886 Transcript_77175/m.204886 type:complete len:167 (-) Transcript_77175:33-533(-)
MAAGAARKLRPRRAGLEVRPRGPAKRAAGASGDGDVVMAAAGRKVRKSIGKRKRGQAKAAPAAAAAPESRRARQRRMAALGVERAAAAKEAPDQLQQRQAAEWKEMKAEVARLKKERHGLPKKGGKELRAAANQKVRQLWDDMKIRHEAERVSAGLPPQPPAGAAP